MCPLCVCVCVCVVVVCVCVLCVVVVCVCVSVVCKCVLMRGGQGASRRLEGDLAPSDLFSGCFRMAGDTH